MTFRPTVQQLQRTTIAIVVGVLSACEQSMNVQVDSTVPSALVQTMPLTVAVYYSDAMRNHTYSEDSEERPNWEIKSGDSQVAMFDQVLSSTFSTVSSIESLPNTQSPATYDVVVVPSIQEMQFATPQETFFDFYEAWIRYDIDMLNGDGSSLGKWEVTAYGKAPQKRFTRRTDGINDAIGLALRDAGAKLATGMLKQPVVVQRLGIRP